MPSGWTAKNTTRRARRLELGVLLLRLASRCGIPWPGSLHAARFVCGNRNHPIQHDVGHGRPRARPEVPFRQESVIPTGPGLVYVVVALQECRFVHKLVAVDNEFGDLGHSTPSLALQLHMIVGRSRGGPRPGAPCGGLGGDGSSGTAPTKETANDSPKDAGG